MEVCNNKISAIDLKKVVMVEYEGSKSKSLFSKEDLEYQESRRQRKVRKLNFEIR
jgi:polynucleotide 5'-kinase involved in rRNA processing